MQGQLNGIPLPDEVLRTPGHYSVVALLPEDHTYAKGSLFILAPGTKCIVFDMDGEYQDEHNRIMASTYPFVLQFWQDSKPR